MGARVTVLALAWLLVACSPSPVDEYREYRSKIAQEAAALLRDRPFSSVGSLTDAELELITLHAFALDTYAARLELLVLDDEILAECQKDLIRTTRRVAREAISIFYSGSTALDELMATLRAC